MQKLNISQTANRLTASRGTWALLDQVLFSASNFLLNILLARWLTEPMYGIFALGFSAFLLASVLQTPLFTEPLMVFSSNRFRNIAGLYQSKVIELNWFFGFLVALAFAGMSIYNAAHPDMAKMYLGLAIGSPWILYSWLTRRICYANLQPEISAKAGVIYMLAFLGMVLLTYRLGQLSPGLAFILMGIASLLAGWWIHRLLPRPVEENLSERQIIQSHWEYGRWSLVGNLLYWVPANLPFLVLSHTSSLSASGELRALFNAILPVASLITALGSLLIPSFARAANAQALEKQMIRTLWVFLAVAGVCWLGLGLLHKPLFALLYGHSYQNASGWLWLMGLQPIYQGIAAVYLSALRAKEYPQWVAALYAVSTLVMLSLGVWLIQGYQVLGAVVAMLISYFILTLCAAIAWWRVSGQDLGGTQ